MNGARSAPVNAAQLPASPWASSQPKSPVALGRAPSSAAFHKAASFSAARRPALPSPCSTPVPIPRSRQRRWSASDSPFAAQDPLLSRTQCEAQLWDDDWHFKLSLEARESFEAAAGDASGSIDVADSDRSSGPEDADDDEDAPAELFEMDDL